MARFRNPYRQLPRFSGYGSGLLHTWRHGGGAAAWQNCPRVALLRYGRSPTSTGLKAAWSARRRFPPTPSGEAGPAREANALSSVGIPMTVVACARPIALATGTVCSLAYVLLCGEDDETEDPDPVYPPRVCGELCGDVPRLAAHADPHACSKHKEGIQDQDLPFHHLLHITVHK